MNRRTTAGKHLATIGGHGLRAEGLTPASMTPGATIARYEGHSIDRAPRKVPAKRPSGPVNAI